LLTQAQFFLKFGRNAGPGHKDLAGMSGG